jgi:antitoxin component of MazEF toxin-antitoxin module
MNAVVKGRITKIGGSLALFIPAQIRRTSGLAVAQEVEVEATAEGFSVRPSRDRPRYTLKELLERSTAKGLRPTADDRVFLDAPTAGAEAW